MDMIFAIVIFSIAILLLTYAWFSISQQFSITYTNTLSNMQTNAQQLSNRLVTTGSPASWYYSMDPSNLSTWTNMSIGFAEINGSALSSAKIAKLEAASQVNYQASKQLLGVNYNYYIQIYSPQLYNYTIGLNPSLYNATTVVVSSTPIIMDNGVPATLKVILWTANQGVSVSTITIYTTEPTTI
jgi:hypothetical protein